MQVLSIVDGIGHDAVAVLEAPAILAHEPMDDRPAYRAFEAFQRAHDEGAMRPRAGIGNIEMVAAGLRLEPAPAGWTGASVGRYPVADSRCLSLETASGPFGVERFAMPNSFDQASHAVSFTPPSSGKGT